MTESSISALLSQDRLSEAVDLATAKVRASAQDLSARLVLIDLYCLQEQFEKADNQAETAGRLHPTEGVGLALLRGRIRGMHARAKWFADGALPSFPGGPTPCDEIALKLGLEAKAGRDAAGLLEELEAARGEVSVSWNGSPAGDFRDLDDRLPHAIEALTDGGAYLWVDLSKIRSIEFEPQKRPLDLAYRQASLELLDGSTAEVLVPAIYPGSTASDGLKLGRSTDWVEENGIVTGRGQRSFLVGEEEHGIHEAETIEIAGGRDG